MRPSGSRREGGGAQFIQRHLMIGPISGSSAIPSVSNRSSSSRAVLSGVVILQSKIATATMSREISQLNACDGVFKDRVEVRELRVEVPPAALPSVPIRGSRREGGGVPTGKRRLTDTRQRLRRYWNPNDSTQIT